MPSKPTLLLVDGHSLAFRSFYAFANSREGGLMTKEGIPTSVTYGFLKSLLENCKTISPEGLTIAFDTSEPTFRHKTDPNYKANRDTAPETFFQDLEQLQEILKNDLNIPICTAPGYEADDVLGTLANRAADEGWRVRILSGDRDLFQLVDDSRDIAIMYMGGGPYSKSSNPTLINEKLVLEKLGVSPSNVIQLKALTGDSSDNIPGIRGVGPKTAITLLKENTDLNGIFKLLENLEHLGEKASQGIVKGALKQKLKIGKKNAYLSMKLAEIIINVPLKNIPSFELKKINNSSLTKSLEKLELQSLIRQIPYFMASFNKGGFKTNIKNNQKKIDDKETENNSNTIPGHSIPIIDPKIIYTKKDLNDLINNLLQFETNESPVSIDTETTHLNPSLAELVGIGICWGEGKQDIAYIPIGHKTPSELKNKNDSQLSLIDVINLISPWLSSKKHPKVLQNAKYDRMVFLSHGIPLEGVIMDTLLGDYIRDATNKHSLEEISKREFNYIPKSFKEIVPKGKTFDYVDIETASKYCGMDVYLTRKISFLIKEDLSRMGKDLVNLLEKVEMPLEPILAEMEGRGITIDINYLNRLSSELNQTLSNIEQKVYEYSNSNFNINSPKQLGDVLFEKLDLNRKKSRKTKTGWSTDINVLEKLENDHVIVPLIIEYRTLTKLLTTYVDALPQLVEKSTGRVHTDFNQAVTATGRLSSSNPNLQNIPIRTDFSRRIRKAFLPQENWKLLSADYSQIELRILAHLSQEETLQKAYITGEDVHSLTAQILLEKDSINSDERRIGKTINFGVVYGMGAQRFARSTGYSLQEAKEFLLRYKQRYPKVFNYLELQERLALSRGYVSTLMGRRRYFHFNKDGLGRLKGKNVNEIDITMARRGGIEAQQLRAAANAPIQGSSADIIKIAMVSLNKKLKELNLPANLLLQVHDELVFEVEPSVIDQVKKVVIETMEKAVLLSVPLVVEVGIGNNWMEAK